MKGFFSKIIYCFLICYLSFEWLAVCSKVEAQEINPLLIGKGLPRFDLIKPEHVVPAFRQATEQLENELKTCESNIKPTWNNLIRPIDHFAKVYEQTISPVLHLEKVKNSPELRESYNTVIGDFFGFMQRFQQSKPFYEGFIALRDSDEWKSLNEVKKRTVNLRILEVELAGVGLKDDKKKRLNEVMMEKMKLGNEYNNNLQDASKSFELLITDKEYTQGWPSTLKNVASQSYNQVYKNTEK